MNKILIVDDDPNILFLFAEILKMDGYNVATASTGTKALQLVIHDHFNLLILDIKMPGIHGLEILRRLREKGNKIPIIICSAFEGMKDDFVIKSYEITDYLVKPVDLKLLSNTVKKTLARNVE
ncbi:response regulator [candidate division WOR-3 bacterium]|nr:response regulator [candidate division WOR-3 bacterium]